MTHKISIIIPFRDHADLLKRCVFSIVNKSTYKNYEIILVNNGSVKRSTREYLDGLSGNEKIKILDYNKPFNFSAINNYAAKFAKGEFLLFLNNDTKVISENWLEEMIKCFENEKVGAVGAKLLYPNGKIQHAGIIVGKNIAVNAFNKVDDREVGEHNSPRICDAVTGACMMTKKELFLKLGGFYEANLPIAYNDVDYCLRLKENGYLTFYTPQAKLYHLESASRKSDINIWAKFFNRKRYSQFCQEQEYMKRKWGLG